MPYGITSATIKIQKLTKRIRAIPGGTSASKTVSVILFLISSAQADKKPTLTSIVSESFPHLKRGAMRDFLMIMQEHNYFKDSLWNRTDSTYTFETGSKIEFFSVDQPSKVRGARRDRLFINEANNIPFEAFEQLEVRTKDFVFLDWNPSHEFWYYTEIKGKRTDVEELVLTYKDNEALSQNIVDSIEQRKGNKEWWKVYGLGLLGEIETRIYKDWNIIDEIPHEARLERRGIDFGFTNDPTAIIDIYRYNDGYILDEQVYRTGMLNRDIADFLLNLPECLNVADSAEPKSIEEIKQRGVNIVGAKKHKMRSFGSLVPETGSKESYVKWSIGIVQQHRMSMTKRSLNLIKAYRNYLWETDKDGKILNVPNHYLSDCLDAIRYAVISLAPVINTQNIVRQIPIYQSKKVNPWR